MQPIYFPFTYISEPVMQALNTYFPSCSVYLPSRRNIPEIMQAWQRRERLHFRVPVTGDGAKLVASLKNYYQWAELHQDRQRSLLSQLQAQNTEIPFFDDTSTSHIRAKLKKMAESSPFAGASGEGNSDPLYTARIFLSIAQELDAQHDAVETDLNALNVKEHNLFSELQGEGHLKQRGHDTNVKFRYLDSRDYMISERLQAWSYLMVRFSSLDAYAPSGLFITSNRIVFEMLKDILPPMQPVVHIESAPLGYPRRESETIDWQQQLMSALEPLTRSGHPQSDPLEIEAPPSAQSQRVCLSIHIIKNQGPIELFSRFIPKGDIAELPPTHAETVANTLIGYFDIKHQ